MLPTFLRFKDLEERQIVTNWPQVKQLIIKQGFPAGSYLSPKTRVWRQDEVAEWLATRGVFKPAEGSK
jgi:predicted DNA-binding transcriptional regulator AlpA